MVAVENTLRKNFNQRELNTIFKVEDKEDTRTALVHIWNYPGQCHSGVFIISLQHVFEVCDGVCSHELFRHLLNMTIESPIESVFSSGL